MDIERSGWCCLRPTAKKGCKPGRESLAIVVSLQRMQTITLQSGLKGHAAVLNEGVNARYNAEVSGFPLSGYSLQWLAAREKQRGGINNCDKLLCESVLSAE